MKFAKILATRVHPQWACNYLDYKSLKKFIKQVKASGDSHETQQEFMDKFMQELNTVDDFFLAQVAAVEKNLNATCERLRGPSVVVGPKSVAVENEVVVWEKIQELLISGDGSICNEFIQWLQGVCNHLDTLRTYVALNHVACRKILKKFDKQTGTTDCQSAIMKDVVAKQPFVRSERLALLLTRLDCIKTLVTNRRAEVLANSEPCEKFSNFNPSLIVSRLDWQCHVCLDTVNRNTPVALACGHRFCAGCADQSAEVSDQCPVCRRNHMLGHFISCDPVIKAFLRHHVPEEVEEAPDMKMCDDGEDNLLQIPALVLTSEDGRAVHPDLGHKHPVELASFSTLMEHASEKAYFVFDIDETIIVPGTFPSMLLSPYGIRSVNQLLQNTHCELRLPTRRYLRQVVMEAVNTRKVIEPITVDVITNLQQLGCTVFCLTARHSRSVQQTKAELAKVGVDFSLTSPFPNNSLLTDPVTGAVCEDGIIFANGNHKGTVLNRFLEGFVFRDLYCLGSDWKTSEEAKKILPDRIVFVDDQLPNCWTVQNTVSSANRFCIPIVSYHYQRASYAMDAELVQKRGYKPALKSQRPQHTAQDEAEGAPVALNQKVLKLQLKYFMSNHVLIGDKEAHRLLALEKDRMDDDELLEVVHVGPKRGISKPVVSQEKPSATAPSAGSRPTNKSEFEAPKKTTSGSLFSIFKQFRAK